MDEIINSSENPLLKTDGIPAFDRIEPEHVEPGMQQILAVAEKQLAAIEQSVEASWEGLLEPLEQLERPFEYSWSAVNHLLGVRNSAELRAAHESILPDVVGFQLRYGQSVPIYNGLKAIRESDEFDQLQEAQQRIIISKLQDAELSGVGLKGEAKQRFNEIARQLSQLSTEFANNVLDATKAWSKVLREPDQVEGFPDSLKQLCAQAFNAAREPDEPEATSESGPWKLSLEMPCFLPVMKFARNRVLREEVYRAYVTRASSGEFDNTDRILETLRLRQAKAELLGFKNFARLSLARKMAPSVDAVQEMFEELRTAAWKAAESDFEQCQQLAQDEGQTEPLQQWDIAYWSERLREQQFDYSDEDLRPYFPLNRVLDGLFALVQHLFGVRVEPADGEAPVWDPAVRFFKVLDESDTHIASFYLDPYSRPENKRGGAWMDTCLNRRVTDGTLQPPIAHLICNSTPPVGEKPSLMTFSEVTTLFHEFGHGLQHLLTRVDYVDAAGINNVEWDAVELPSQFMENWCYHRPTVMGLSGHYETGEPLPDELFEKLCAARTFRAGSMMLRQLNFGMTDMRLHSDFDCDGSQSVFEVQQEIARQTSVLPPLPEDRFLCGFQHIFAGGYAAGYYSYKWAEVLSADAFAAFEEAGLDDDEAVRATGRRFRETVLALGGGRHPMDVFRDFRGREPSYEALLKHNGLAATE